MVFVLAIVLSFVPAFLGAAWLYWVDRYEKEPRLLLVGAFIWGAVVATFGALVANTVFQTSVYLFTGSESAAEVTTAVISAPVVEEALKGLAVLIVVLALRNEFDTVLDGIVYASITALGFAATENVLYLTQASSEGGIGALLVLFVLRIILGLWNHAVFTSFTGIGLALARLTHNGFLKVLLALGGWGLAITMHALHNGTAVFLGSAMGLSGLLATLLIDWIGWVLMLAIVIWAALRERRWMRTYLNEEVTFGLISPAQYEAACSLFRQLRASATGRGNARSTARFYQLCGELALKKHQLATYGEESGNTATIQRLRQEMASLAPVANA